MAPDRPAVPAPQAGPALAALPAGARLDPGIAVSGDALNFPPRTAWLWLPVALAAGPYRLTLATADATGLRLELMAPDGGVALPLTPMADGRLAVRFALDAPLASMRMMPCEAGPVRFTHFACEPAPDWRTLLPDWQLGPVRVPVRQDATAPVTMPPAPLPGADAGLAVTAIDGLSLAGNRVASGRAGAMRLALPRPLGPGRHVMKADFVAADGGPALVAPRLYRDGAAPNAPPLAHFRRRTRGRYKAVIDLDAPADHLILQPRQERGSVHLARLRLFRPAPALRPFERLGEAWRAHRQRLLAPLGRLIGADPRRDGTLARLVRLLSLEDRRFRRALRRREAARVARWLARPVLRPGTLRVAILPGPDHAVAATRASLAACSDGDFALTDRPAEADLVLAAGSRPLRHALAAVRRAAPGGPVAFDTDRRVLGLRSAPRFAAPAPAEGRATVPLVLAHRPRRPRRAPLAAPARTGAMPPVSIVTATRDAPDHLGLFLRTLRATQPDGAELILVDNGTRNAKALALLEAARGETGVRVIADDRPFNFAAMSNLGASLARGEMLVFANNDIEFRYPRWAEALAGALDDPDTAIAGALLDYPDGRVQHAGVVLAGEARVRHLERFSHASGVGYFGRWQGVSAVTAVTGALMAVRRSDFAALGGFAAGRYPVLYNDVDLCLRAGRAGRRTVLAGGARAVHHESVTFKTQLVPSLRERGGPLWRMERAEEADRFRQDWADLLDADPCYPHGCDPVEAAFRARE
ncbi:MAG: hypothetical protein AcusKO_48140 [Acuticoccus sp.]